MLRDSYWSELIQATRSHLKKNNYEDNLKINIQRSKRKMIISTREI